MLETSPGTFSPLPLCADLLETETKDGEITYQTIRIGIPEFVSKAIEMLYAKSELSKGCPDLVIWNERESTIRFVEVKCPHWDRAFPEQLKFMHVAEENGIGTKIVEWEFQNA